MKYPKIWGTLLVGILIGTSTPTYAATYVHGYTKSDGTYVAPYYRSSPDGNPYNNWSTKGNINPYTGKEGTKNPYPSAGSVPNTEYPITTPASAEQIQAGLNSLPSWEEVTKKNEEEVKKETQGWQKQSQEQEKQIQESFKKDEQMQEERQKELDAQMKQLMENINQTPLTSSYEAPDQTNQIQSVSTDKADSISTKVSPADSNTNKPTQKLPKNLSQAKVPWWNNYLGAIAGIIMVFLMVYAFKKAIQFQGGCKSVKDVFSIFFIGLLITSLVVGLFPVAIFFIIFDIVKMKKEKAGSGQSIVVNGVV